MQIVCPSACHLGFQPFGERRGGNMTALEPHLVRQKSKSDDLRAVRALNLWGHDIADVSMLEELPNVEVLSLSVNRISTLRPFSHCQHLQELYLRKNLVSDLSEVAHLSPLKRLRVLWLSDNPCAEQPGYRVAVASTLKSLQKLDNMEVSDHERNGSSLAPPDTPELQASPFSPVHQTPARSATPARPPEPQPPARSATPQSSPEPPHNQPHQQPQPAQAVSQWHSADSHDAGNPRYEPTLRLQSSPQQLQQVPSQSPNEPSIRRDSQLGASANVLYATMSLLGELDRDSLAVVRNECERLLQCGR